MATLLLSSTAHARVSDQGTALRASDLHNERETIPNAFPECEQNIQSASGRHGILAKS